MGLEWLGLAQGWEGIRAGAEVAVAGSRQSWGGSLMGVAVLGLCRRQESRNLPHLFRALVAGEAAELGKGNCLDLGGEGNVSHGQLSGADGMWPGHESIVLEWCHRVEQLKLMAW